jgi:SIR2-like domain
VRSLRYITEVIQYHTPEIEPHRRGQLPGNWYNWAFGVNDIWNPYGLFVGSLLNLRLTRVWAAENSYEDIVVSTNSESDARYSIITLNYDLIPEMICNFINKYYAHKQGERRISFSDSSTPENLWAPSISKLHGSIDKGNIVPPTWNKSNSPDIVPAWKLAYELLARANHIRIIGYSLPITDTYVKYLLKSAVVQNEHLKMIDVICLDPDGSVKARYDDFISFQYYRFFNRNAEKYLAIVKANSGGGQDEIALNKLETAHRSFSK